MPQNPNSDKRGYVLENFLLFCPKCKKTFLISVQELKIKYENKPDAKTQS